MGRLTCWADEGRASDSIQRFQDFFMARYFIITPLRTFYDPDSNNLTFAVEPIRAS